MNNNNNNNNSNNAILNRAKDVLEKRKLSIAEKLEKVEKPELSSKELHMKLGLSLLNLYNILQPSIYIKFANRFLNRGMCPVNKQYLALLDNRSDIDLLELRSMLNGLINTIDNIEATST